MNGGTRGLAVALATALVSLSGGAAQADRSVVDDPLRDVWQTVDDAEQTWDRAGTRANVDIDRSVLWHGSRQVVATTTYRVLRKRGDRYVSGWLIRTDASHEFQVTVAAGPEAWAGEVAVYYTNPPPINGEAEGPPVPVECDAMHAIDYASDTLQIRFPRSCLGDPEWIRGMSLAESHTLDGSSSRRDHGHHRGHALRGWTRRLDAG